MAAYIDFLVDCQELLLRCLASLERAAREVALETIVVDDAKHASDCLVRVAQDRVVQFQRFGKFAIGFRRIATGREIGDVELTQGGTALTERFALGRSATGKRLGKPGDDHRLLTLVIR